ncbi:metallophosphoesterase [Porcipelethomonas sp.]|uniref:metallophosphoesterase n=1 Tax=Porcipelethomonas sp. TaxID=2981675 RepID=UPI003EF62D50
MKTALFIFYITAVFLLYVFVENRLLITRRYKISWDNQENTQGLKIVQISDVHKRTYLSGWRVLVSRIKELEPDIILITGDLVSRNTKSLKDTQILLEKLCRICPVYCSLGNHELELKPEIMAEYRSIMKKSGAVLLENSNEVFEKDGRTVNIYGADLKLSAYKNERGRYSDLESVTAGELVRDLGEKKDGFTILMAHNPFFFDEYAKWGADVTFSGHVHGGAVRLPVLGGVLSPERKFFPEFSKGVYRKDGKYMLVSTGIGKLRVFNPPEILFAFLTF